MFLKTELEVKLLKEKYPKGTTVRCLYMNDPYNPVPRNTLGTVNFVDDIGQIHVSWENGSSLALNIDEDDFEII